MKLAIGPLLVMSFLLFSQLAKSQDFKQGTHYTVVDNLAKPQTAEVVEYFSFSCPGCYALEPHIKNVLKSKSGITLRRVHMPFGGSKAQFSQKAFVLMHMLGAESYKDAIFERIHNDRNYFDSDQELVQFFENLGYMNSAVEKKLRSFSADTMIRTMNKEGRDAQIKSVPTLIVNGRYNINMQAIYSGASLNALIQYLNAKPSPYNERRCTNCRQPM